MNLLKASAFAAVLGGALGVARADTPPDDASATGTATATVSTDGPTMTTTSADASVTTDSSAAVDSLVLPKGKLEINAFLTGNLSEDAVFKPFSISPDIWYGATDDVTVGLVHSAVGSTGFISSLVGGESLCLSGDDNGCGDFYHNVGVDVRGRIVKGWTVDLGVYAVDLDPFAVDAKIGFSNRWLFAQNKLAIEVQPNIFIGLNKRDEGNNKELLNIPVTFAYSVAPKFDIDLQTGFSDELGDHPGNNYRVPLSVGVRYQVNNNFSAGLAFTLPALISGYDTVDATTFRTIVLGGSYAL